MRKRPVLWFYVLAFGICWLGWVPQALGSHGVAPFAHPLFGILLLLPAVGPALAAVIVTRAAYGQAAVSKLLGRLVQWRAGLLCYAVALVGPAALLVSAQAITRWLGLPVGGAGPQGEPLALAISALVMSLLSNPWEEVGWRGFALPHLERRHGALVASLLVGVLWGLWHLPLFFWAGNPMAGYPFLPWFIGTVASAFLYTWLYNRSGGSLVPVTLFHVVLNTLAMVVRGVSVVGLAVVHVLVALALAPALGRALPRPSTSNEPPNEFGGW